MFSSSCDSQQNMAHTDLYMDAVTPNSKFNIQAITENEVDNIISKLKNSKGMYLDLIPIF